MMMMALTYKWEKTSKEKSKYKGSEDAYVLKGKDNYQKLPTNIFIHLEVATKY